MGACSRESTIILSALINTSSFTSCALQVVGPAATTVVPGDSHVPSITGSIVAAMEITMSVSSTTSLAESTDTTGILNRFVIFAAKDSRCSAVGLNAFTDCMFRTLDIASSWVGAWYPVPIMPTVEESGLDKYLTAIPVVAPVLN